MAEDTRIEDAAKGENVKNTDKDANTEDLPEDTVVNGEDTAEDADVKMQPRT